MPFAGVTPSSVLLLLVILGASPSCHGGASHRITTILAADPDFAEFSDALGSTNLTAEIDRRTTITVLAVDNAAMARLKARRLPQENLRRVLSLHVLLDYFDAAKLRNLNGPFALATSLYQASGVAPGSAGIVNITAVPGGGRVTFAPYGAAADAGAAVFYQRSVQETPYDIAVLQVSAVLSSPAAEAQVPEAPSRGFTDLMSKNGCGGFAGLVTTTANAAETYQKRVGGGLTVFCPVDKVVTAFSPTFKNLTADGQLSLLLYHAVAAHYSETALKTINGEASTLAADGAAKSYNLTVHADGDMVKLSSSSRNEARVTKTVVDREPLAVYLIDAVLLPRELLNDSGAAAPSPRAPVAAPSPAPSQAPSRKRHPAPPPKPAATPAPAPKQADTPAAAPDVADKPPADQKGQHKNGAASGTAASWSLGAAVAAAAVPAVVFALW